MTEEKVTALSTEDKKLSPCVSDEISTKKTEVFLPSSTTLVSSADERPFKCYLDVPCPKQTHDDISQDYEVNNWVLNHLPFRDEAQRESFAKNLLLDQMKAEKEKKQQKQMQKVKQKSKLERQKSSKTLPTFSSPKKLKARSRHFLKTHGKETTEE
jgi:hypothetical protein